MSQAFDGFPKRDKLTALPETFFSELLPLVDDLAELKVLLFFMWAVQQREGNYRYLSRADFATSQALRAGLAVARPDTPPDDTLDAALNRAVTRGTLLCETIHDMDGPTQTLYFMNTERGREAATAIREGHYTQAETIEILPPRPNIYRLYEQEIGPITPMIADGLKDLENDYPAAWLPEAVRVAAEKQAKHLKFIRSVLESWRKEGKTTDEITRRHKPQPNVRGGRERFGGKYADWLDQ
jgi:DNA replication protein